MWFCAGLLFGLLGLIAAAGLPDRHQIVYLRHLAEAQGYRNKGYLGRNEAGKLRGLGVTKRMQLPNGCQMSLWQAQCGGGLEHRLHRLSLLLINATRQVRR